MAKKNKKSTRQIGLLLGNRLMVGIMKPEDVTVGGIVLPDMSKERKNCGTVLRVGTGVAEDIREGDRVTFMPFGAVEMMFPEGLATVIDVEDIVFISGIR